MRVHHLNCMTMCPVGGRLMDGRERSSGKAKLVCHCLLIETDRQGLVLVDTGFGMRDVRKPRQRLSPVFRRLNRPSLAAEETAISQIERLGFHASDVRDIVLTHLDFDHAGGLDDFPAARVHLLAREREVATRQRSWLDRQRFRPEQWSSAERWETYEAGGERWFDFDSVRAASDLDDEILLIPLPGHTLGHAGVAVRQADHWLLHCGDAYFYEKELDAVAPQCTPGLRVYQAMMEQDRALRLENQRRLRALAHRQASTVQLFCAHDPTEFERLRRYQVSTRGANRAPRALHRWSRDA